MEERRSAVWVEEPASTNETLGQSQETQDMVRMSLSPLVSSELFPDTPVWMLPRAPLPHKLPISLLQRDPKNRPLKAFAACMVSIPAAEGRHCWVGPVDLLGTSG